MDNRAIIQVIIPCQSELAKEQSIQCSIDEIKSPRLYSKLR